MSTECNAAKHLTKLRHNDGPKPHCRLDVLAEASPRHASINASPLVVLVAAAAAAEAAAAAAAAALYRGAPFTAAPPGPVTRTAASLPERWSFSTSNST
eukprot:CAMPEP_0203996920 /NCGR_PEP_ID=MMETSP0360-20130528/13050_1 /ASSEMBLY_ACC=CAM_ASM_000342 /TAXON_ID=268821 /ORGANISM="Scrippsiella Hangoei, Strain SHTV-5" /LENGTH=98 /DNA_ID=CAMNT_0050937791 /DNA_START=114 /DNA_END=407 /DNA_ORIENTATION=-